MAEYRVYFANKRYNYLVYTDEAKFSRAYPGESMEDGKLLREAARRNGALQDKPFAKYYRKKFLEDLDRYGEEQMVRWMRACLNVWWKPYVSSFSFSLSFFDFMTSRSCLCKSFLV
jgi:hypothetical protein